MYLEEGMFVYGRQVLPMLSRQTSRFQEKGQWVQFEEHSFDAILNNGKY